MAKILTIYCEGKKGSHDFDLLGKIIADIAVTIKPIGGKRGANAGTKTSFSPNSKNKTTSVAKQYSAHNNLITSLKTSTMI
jgi:uncharacterized protein (DUF342 family)